MSQLASRYVRVSKNLLMRPGSVILKKITNPYRGRLQAAILDWSGTTVDPYVNSVARPMMEAFKNFGVPITNREARKPMGNKKDIHIRKICEDPNVSKRLKKFVGEGYNVDKVAKHIFEDYSVRQIEWLGRPEIYKLLPHVKTTVDTTRKIYGLTIGSTTGFLGSMQNVLVQKAAEQGYKADTCVASDDVPRARPYPDGVMKNLLTLGVDSVGAVVKVDDTKSGIMEGNNAGTYTVGLSRYNNFMGEQFDNTDDIERMEKENPALFRKLLDMSNEHLMEAQPDFIAESFDELTRVYNYIDDPQLIGATDLRGALAETEKAMVDKLKRNDQLKEFN
jgi:phosphonoacetaldehyde hydrolase